MKQEGLRQQALRSLSGHGMHASPNASARTCHHAYSLWPTSGEGKGSPME